MTFASATLRVLLAIALLVNGMGGAMASPGKAVTPGASGSGCHEHAAMGHHSTAVTGNASTSTPHPDHCTPDHCRCACMPSLQASTSLATWLPATPNRSHGVPTVIPAHADPALPHLIRPPIG